MVGLVSLAVLPDERVDVLGDVVRIPGNGEERVEMLFEVGPALVEGNQSFRVMRCKEGRLPCVGLAVHVLVVGILRIEVLYPVTVVQAAAHQFGRWIEHILVIFRALHQHLIVRLVPEFLGQQGDGVIVVGDSSVLVTPALPFVSTTGFATSGSEIYPFSMYSRINGRVPPSTVAFRSSRL